MKSVNVNEMRNVNGGGLITLAVVGGSLLAAAGVGGYHYFKTVATKACKNGQTNMCSYGW